MRMKDLCSAAAGATALLLMAGCNPGTGIAPTDAPNDWLINAEDDETRLRRLQDQLRGMDVAMWEVGQRYEQLHAALGRENYDLALYHWNKIEVATTNALVKRPARRASAESIFLSGLTEQVRKGFESRDPEQAWAAFESARTACIACHQAEKVGYMGNQPMFDLRRPGAVE